MWYRTGTISVTNGSATVTGAGTAFVENVRAGYALEAPDGRTYEVAEVVSNTQLTLATPYLGASASGQGYALFPTQGMIPALTDKVKQLIDATEDMVLGIGAGLFPDGTAALPAFRFAGDQDTGFFRPNTNAVGVATGGAERARFTDTGLGLGTGSPSARLHILLNTGSSAAATMALYDNPYHNRAVRIGTTGEGGAGGTIQATGAGGDTTPTNLLLNPNGGNIGVGTLAPAARLEARGSSPISAVDSASAALRLSSGGTSVILLAGSSASGDGMVQASADGSPWRLALNPYGGEILAGGGLRPNADNSSNLGGPSHRWATVYAGTGTINTSDEREKTWRGALTDDEYQAGLQVLDELGFYQWNDAIAEKGPDGARYHFGVRAQQVWAIFAAHSLVDPIGDGEPGETPYAFLCFDKWEEQREPIYEEVTVTKTRTVQHPSSVIDPLTGQPAMIEVEEEYEEVELQPTGEERVVVEAGSRYGIRPTDFALFLLAVQARRQSEIEARLEALEAAE